MADKKRTIFLTGATGLLGSYLMKILLENGHKVYALARDKANLSAEQRVKDVLGFWGAKLPLKDPVVLKGDITKKRLGLDEETVRKLQDEIEEIYHFAAIINFNWLLSRIRRVNVIGTQSVLDFAQECRIKGALRKVNHISTAYIYGSYQGVFNEDKLDVGQKFNTTYEQTKFEAEKIVYDKIAQKKVGTVAVLTTAQQAIWKAKLQPVYDNILKKYPKEGAEFIAVVEKYRAK